jgi:hypothetical protein
VFPQLDEVPGSTKQTESETTAKNKGTDGIRNLKVALPYSDDTVRCLSAMFYYKNNGIWDSSVSGSDVNIQTLMSASTNYVIQNIGVTNDGASLENLNGWKETGEEPDLFLVSDTQSASEAGLVSELSVYASRNKSIDGAKIFAASMSNLLEGGKLYGIPHYCSATVIFGNRDYIPKDGRLQAKYTTEDLSKYLELTNTSYKCVPMASAYKLVPYLGSCFSDDRAVSYMLNEEYRIDKEKAEPVISSLTGYVKKLYDSKLSINTGKDGADPVFSRNGLVTTIAWGMNGTVNYALEGSIFVAGAAIQWLRDELRLIDSAMDSEYMAKKVPDTNGCYVVPAFTGLGAPYWDPYARGTIVGITRGVNKYHIIRATLESLAFQVNDVLQAMAADCGISLRQLKVDGGASANDFLLQTQADLCGIPVQRPKCVETTALGAAYLAGLAVGYWKNTDEIKANWQVDNVFKPAIREDERRKRIAGWDKAVGYSRGWAKDEELS